MKLGTSTLLLLASLAIGCSQSSSSDLNPTPTPTPSPTPSPTPDYSSCRYVLNYKLSYSPLSKTKPTTITYLDSTQKAKTVTLTDTLFKLTISYKYGDSVYVKLSPYVYFLNKPVSGTPSTNNKIAVSGMFTGTSSSTCNVSFQDVTGGTTINRDSVSSSGYWVSPRRLAR